MDLRLDPRLNDAPCGFLTLADDGTVRRVNATLLSLLGYTHDEMQGQHVQVLLSVSGRVFYQTHFFPRLTLHYRLDEVYFSLRSKSGESIPMLVNAVRRECAGDFENDCILVPMRQRNQYEEDLLRAKKAAEDATRTREQARAALDAKQEELLQLNAELVRAKNELELRVSERTAELAGQQAFLRRVLDTDPNLIFVKDENGKFTLANQAVATLYGTTVEAIIGKSDADFNSNPEEVARFAAADSQVIQTGQDRFVAEEAITDAGGQVRWLQTLKCPLASPEGRVRHLLGVSADITAHKQAEERLAHQAFHDTLTKLPNRALFLNRLERSLARIERTGAGVAVLFLDLDNFKVINDSLGHEAGDIYLQEIAQRLSDCVRPGDTVARFGGDEFTVLLDEITEPIQAQLVAERLAEALRAPLTLMGRKVFPGASMGIAVASQAQYTPRDLLRDADTAMYHAKTSGKGCHLLFDRSMNEQALERLELEADLRRALEQEELLLHFQPIVDLATQKIREAEALVRWEHPTRGLIMPAKFIPIAEETGLIVPLGRWVLHEACRQARIWQEQYPCQQPFVVGVNLSSQQLAQAGLIEDVVSALKANQLSPKCLKLEITESIMVTDIKAAAHRLNDLQAMGVQIAMDDFGTGYSSMSYLSSLPLRTLKIDRTFVSQLGGSGEEQAIVRAIVTLAKSLGLSVTSEGIETAEQLRYLLSLGCDLGQGYYFSRPVPAEAIGKWLSAAGPLDKIAIK